MKKLVTKTSANNPMTPAQMRELTKLAALPDSTIDYSDIPELTESFFKNAIRNPFYRSARGELTVNLDADVFVWLRKQGEDYQTRANQVLREVMLQDVRKSA